MLVEKQRGALRIVALDKAAARNKLRLGMALAEARTWVPTLKVGEGDAQADHGFRLEIATACERFTPLVALRGNDGLVLDITGCAHLFGGERALGGQACRLLAAMGVTTQAAIAGTPDAAWAFARFTRGGAVERDEEERLARGLPVTALEAEIGTTIALSRAGLRTIGDLAERPASLLVARFGEEIASRLERLLGRADIRITPLREPADIMAEKHFPEPVSVMDSLLGVLERLAGDVSTHLERREAGGRLFEAAFFRSDGAVRRIAVETARGTRDPHVLMRLLRLKIEALADPLDPGFGFDAIRLGVFRSESLPGRQGALESGAREGSGEGEEALSDLVGRLVARFGRENVLGFVMNDTHDPVRAGGTASCLSLPATGLSPALEPGQPPARPLTLFPHPQPIEVIAEVPDGPPHRFRWRRVPHEVTRAEGPERIAPEWWRPGEPGEALPATRDYYRIEDATGHRFWVFREGLYERDGASPRWFVHGLFS